MLNEVAYSTIPFDKGQTTLRVFNDHDPRVARGINAQWHYDGHGQHFHIWNTAFGFESSAEVEYSGSPDYHVANSMPLSLCERP